VQYSLLLVESDTPKRVSLAHTFNGDAYRVAQTFSAVETEMWLAANVPDAIVVNLTNGVAMPPYLTEMIAKIDFGIPLVAVVTDAVLLKKPDDANCYMCPPEKIHTTVVSVIEKSHLVRGGQFVLDVTQRRLWSQGAEHRLTPKLAALIQLLLENQGQIVYRATIMNAVWHTEYLGDTRTLDVHIRWLREIIELNPSRPKHLLTVRGAGYRFIV